MSQINIPLEALKDEETFRYWYARISQQLFPVSSKHHLKNMTNEIYDKRLEKVECIMKYVNMMYNKEFVLIPYRQKKRKLKCKYADIMGTTIYIIRANFNITVVELGKLLNISHTTVSYYIKKHAGLIKIDPKYKEKYLKLVRILEDEKIIPITKNSKSDSKWLLPDVLSDEK